mmetsp:Transcript_7222/g.20352  ORF Transcript_7222/g.20352 Transcript_7222/m.20352 type:complete len:412 (-) Transcript_7222:135-1370(-)
MASPDMMPCRWAAFQGDLAEDPTFIDLPPVEQVSRGKELLNLLHAPGGMPKAGRSAVTNARREARAEAVQMIVKRTFIELIAPPARPARPRAMSDSALSRKDRSGRAKSEPEAEVLAEMSEASTDAPSEHDEATSQQWCGEVDAGYWAQQPEAFAVACSVDPACMTPMMPQAMQSMPGMQGMWMQGGFDETGGFYPYPAVSMDPMMSWQWAPPQAYLDPYGLAGDAAQAFEGPLASPSAASSCSLAQEAQGGAATGEGTGPKTTVLLRNLPEDFTRAALLELLEDEGFEGTFDFVYLPMDFGAKVCLGYAFVNFVSGSDAQRCWEIFSGYSDWESDKVCEVTWGEPCQGLQAHIDRYRNSPVMHKSIPEEWKPLIFQDGARLPFPAPTKSISAPKLRRRAGKEDPTQAASR